MSCGANILASLAVAAAFFAAAPVAADDVAQEAITVLEDVCSSPGMYTLQQRIDGIDDFSPASQDEIAFAFQTELETFIRDQVFLGDMTLSEGAEMRTNYLPVMIESTTLPTDDARAQRVFSNGKVLVSVWQTDTAGYESVMCTAFIPDAAPGTLDHLSTYFELVYPVVGTGFTRWEISFSMPYTDRHTQYSRTLTDLENPGNARPTVILHYAAANIPN